jgi:hypothetical protein
MGLAMPHGLTVTCQADNAFETPAASSLLACWRRSPRTWAGWKGG